MTLKNEYTQINMMTVKLQLISKSAPPLFATLAIQESFHQQVVFPIYLEKFHMKCSTSLHLHFWLKAATFVGATGRSQAIRQSFNLTEPFWIYYSVAKDSVINGIAERLYEHHLLIDNFWLNWLQGNDSQSPLPPAN